MTTAALGQVAAALNYVGGESVPMQSLTVTNPAAAETLGPGGDVHGH
jgi:hypothetical protein